jgi:hypothetical protein
MPTVLTSDDREDVKEKLRSSPLIQQDTPILLKMVIRWVISIITSLLNYISYFIGVISDDVAASVASAQLSFFSAFLWLFRYREGSN